jgi:hypothetical protein
VVPLPLPLMRFWVLSAGAVWGGVEEGEVSLVLVLF